MRSLLFVPADSERKIEKALASAADVVILDLEDSVAPANKPAARELAAATLKQPRNAEQLAYVRVNALDSGLTAQDIEAVLPSGPDGLIHPKTETGACVETVAGMAGKAMPIIAIATETAKAMFGLGTYGGVNANLKGLAWGAEDLSNALGAQANRTSDGALTEPYRHGPDLVPLWRARGWRRAGRYGLCGLPQRGWPDCRLRGSRARWVYVQDGHSPGTG
jgi:citrate lyase subunit beta/citryl-CoA lyase